jgi:uncharacterized integral membrane protein (TIGR00698 family)
MASRPVAARPAGLDAGSLLPAVSAVLPGLALCAALALGATLVARASGVPAMLLVLVAGFATRLLAPGFVARVAAGIGFSASTVLRCGIVLLGLRVVASDIATLGPATIGLVVGSVAVTVGGGYLIARFLFRQPADVAAVAATSVAICGASAALAASAVVPKRPAMERETLLVIIVVSLLSTVVMVAYPAVAALLGLSGSQTAVLLGAAIHDVAQVAGAGFSVSPETGVAAVTVKMIRVACLLPVVATIGFLACRGQCRDASSPPRRLLPAFLVGFFVLALLASAGAVPASVAAAGGQAATWALTVAVAALGLKTGFGELRAARPALLATLAAQTALQFGVVLTLVLLVTR